jgi:response regulator of citrate/malate metabolism
VTGPIRVLVVEDEPVAAEAHRQYVTRVPGFEVAGVAHTGADAVRAVAAAVPGVDLVLLDMHLPDRHGLDVVRAMRAAGHPADVIAITSARDLGVVRAAVSQGIVQYLLKPFTFPALRERLERYAEFRAQVGAAGEAAGQQAVDRALAALRAPPTANPLPKGMTPQTLDAVAADLRGASGASSASEVAGRVGTSRVTARRYLEYLAEAGAVERTQRYGGPGRPEVAYRWTPTRR